MIEDVYSPLVSLYYVGSAHYKLIHTKIDTNDFPRCIDMMAQCPQ